jgi:AAA15 family ATPase/GTPase
MIYRLEIENFYSILDRQVIDLRVPATTPDIPGRFAPICDGAKDRAPKVVVLFGANAAGKTNVLRAIALIAWFLRDSFEGLRPGSAVPYARFNSEVGAESPTRLAIEFSGPATLSMRTQPTDTHDHLYRYAVAFANGKGEAPRVVYEALHRKPLSSKRMHRVFERFEDGLVKAGPDFRLAGYANVIEMVRGNVSTVATLAQFAHDPSLFLQAFFGSVNVNMFFSQTRKTDEDIILNYANDARLLALANDEIARFDFGIREMRIVSALSGPVAVFDHVGLAEPMTYGLESHGTKIFLEILPEVVRSLKQGGVAVIDELDMSIHPRLMPEFVRWFYDPDENPYGAQLWTACHNASLLEELEKEEVFLCEKDWNGRTKVFAVADFRGVRRTDNLYRRYLSGVFGAVPHVG